MASIHIGTSGWSYPYWLGRFYPEKMKAREQFAFYTRHFDTVEINNSFYRLPPREVFENWYRESPNNFLFAVKANRFITHMLKLTKPEEPINRLFHSIEALKEKLGPVLFQLPPGWKVNVERLRNFLQALPTDQRYAFEFRNETWYRDEVYEVLQQHGAAFCIYHLAGHHSPITLTADFAYVRLHGPTELKYQGSYSKSVLKKWTAQCLQWQKEKKDVYVYFDNDQEAYAAFNAQELKKLVEKESTKMGSHR